MGANKRFKDGECSSEPQNWSQGNAGRCFQLCGSVPQDLIQGCHHGDQVGITISISAPHPDTPAPAEQHHPLPQMASPKCSCSRHRVPQGVSSRFLSAFEPLQQVLPICTPPCTGSWAVHLTQGNTATVTRVSLCCCLQEPC